MECPNCQNKDIFRLHCWGVRSSSFYVRSVGETSPPTYNVEDEKNHESNAIGIYPESEVMCMECKFEGHVILFDDGNFPYPVEPEPRANYGEQPRWKKAVARVLGLH